MMRSLAERAIPDLYPKLELGSREVDGTEAEEFLKQANLSNLSPLFHSGEKGLGLVTKAEGGQVRSQSESRNRPRDPNLSQDASIPMGTR